MLSVRRRKNWLYLSYALQIRNPFSKNVQKWSNERTFVYLVKDGFHCLQLLPLTWALLDLSAIFQSKTHPLLGLVRQVLSNCCSYVYGRFILNEPCTISHLLVWADGIDVTCVCMIFDKLTLTHSHVFYYCNSDVSDRLSYQGTIVPCIYKLYREFSD